MPCNVRQIDRSKKDGDMSILPWPFASLNYIYYQLREV